MKSSGTTLFALTLAGVVAYFLFNRNAAAAPFASYASARPFDVLSTDPNITAGSTPGGYQPPVFGVPILPAPGGAA